MNAKIHRARKNSRLEKALIQQLNRCKLLTSIYLKESDRVEGSNIKYFQGLAHAYEDVERQLRDICKRNNIQL